jgi:hypothetical protein
MHFNDGYFFWFFFLTKNVIYVRKTAYKVENTRKQKLDDLLVFTWCFFCFRKLLVNNIYNILYLSTYNVRASIIYLFCDLHCWIFMNHIGYYRGTNKSENKLDNHSFRTIEV